MGKRRHAFDEGQLDLGFGVPESATSDGALAALPRETASAVAAILRGEARNRYDVAAAMSALLDDEVSKLMVDAYASEARDGHRISFDRMLVLIAATGRYDVLRALLRRIGCDLLVGEEVHLAEIGHLEARQRQLTARLKMLRSVAEPRTGDRK
ncbi:hypothetical protein [Reyranella sp.]|uniref:hypothetical protein n=1 Tax=Reyranella sp. TaxID=1929291 RepID=UPI0027301352|nr:hypothetical protein [Reyranella sp.]MDP2376563.1 hypothetical protein [Reyranella sp.]